MGSIKEPTRDPGAQATGPAAHHDVREVKLQDGSKLVVIDGQPYGEADVVKAKLTAAKHRLGGEAFGCGLAAAWIYIGLPVVAGLLIVVVLALNSCIGPLAGR
jgi:hypothetical protein